MATQPVNPSILKSTTLATAFKRAAPENLFWAQERQFFQIQVQKVTDANDQIEADVVRNVDRTMESLRHAALTCAAMGLSMNPAAALVYFIPRRERKYNKQIDESYEQYERTVPWIITATPSYRGVAWICTHYAGADDVAAEIVFKADQFTLRGPFHLPDHLPTTDLDERNHGKAIGVYCGIRWPNGRERSEYVDRTMIERIRAMSDRPNSIMWDPSKLWTEGWKKAAVRRASKLGIQGNPRVDAAETAMIHAGERIYDGETGLPEREPDPETPPPKRSKGAAGLKEALKEAGEQADGLKRDAAVEGAAITPQEPRSADPPPEGSPAPDLKSALKARLAEGQDWFAPSTHPPTSIEWWGDQLKACKSRAELERVRLQAIDGGVDKGPDALAFTDLYRKQSQAIREGRA